MSDNRSVATDALATLGKIINATAGRDAIHLAVEPTKAQMVLMPGVDVGVDGTTRNPVGIVDPFLKQPVKKGEMFWLILYPRTITSLRHVWSHPAFPDSACPAKCGNKERAESEKWLRNFADGLFSYYNGDEDHNEYGSPLELLLTCAESGGFPTDIEYEEGNKPTAEFWEHFERYTGKRVATKHEWFHCAC